MATSLLTTKLYIPPPRANLVPRPHLIERLDVGVSGKLTLISAPAGFGKTTLLSEWIHHSGEITPPLPVAWVSLDEGDNDLARFLSYVVAALQTIGIAASIGEGAQAPAGANVTPRPSVESVLFPLINQITTAAPGPFVLVFDDFHLIESQPVHDALTFLLDHLPPRMHLVIASRSDPPLHLSRLRARGQMTELRESDLRFTTAEAAAFLNRMMGLNLSTEDVVTLENRTEGWVAGLQLAALSMRARDDRRAFVQSFAGSNRYILDYLVDEVLERQSRDVQSFLLRTAILNRLTGPLCDAVVDLPPQPGEDSGQAMLESLERANLFIVPLDDERRWYRYHRLFADLLRKRLGQAQPDLVPVLHRRASVWYEHRAASLGDNGLMVEAINHALSGEDLERAAHLIEQSAESAMMRSEIATLLGWVERLPDELVRARPSLYVFNAWALLLSGRPLDVDAMQLHLQGLQPDADRVPGGLATLRAFIALFQGQMASAAGLSRQALEQLPADDWFLRGVATWIMGISLVNGDLTAGSRALEKAVRMSQQVGNVTVAVGALKYLAGLSVRQGQIRKARAIYEQALELAADEQGRPLPVAGEAMIGLGELWREWNDLEAATNYLVQGIELASRGREIAALAGYMSLARVKQAQGDVGAAQDAIQRAQRLAVKSDTTDMDDILVALCQARIWIAQGNIEAAMGWIEDRGLDRDTGTVELEGREGFVNYHVRKYEQLALVRVLIPQGRLDEALMLLDALLLRMEGVERNRLVIEIQMLKALALQAQGNTTQAMKTLKRALSLAEPEGYVRLFLDEGPPMARLLYQAAERGVAPEYTSQLLAAFSDSDFEPVASAETQKARTQMVEPLSRRELQVLQLIAEGLSNREIAGRLVVSLSTVKGHTANIYGKLAVNSRTQAISKAKVLGILPDF